MATLSTQLQSLYASQKFAKGKDLSQKEKQLSKKDLGRLPFIATIPSNTKERFHQQLVKFSKTDTDYTQGDLYAGFAETIYDEAYLENENPLPPQEGHSSVRLSGKITAADKLLENITKLKSKINLSYYNQNGILCGLTIVAQKKEDPSQPDRYVIAHIHDCTAPKDERTVNVFMEGLASTNKSSGKGIGKGDIYSALKNVIQSEEIQTKLIDKLITTDGQFIQSNLYAIDKYIAGDTKSMKLSDFDLLPKPFTKPKMSFFQKMAFKNPLLQAAINVIGYSKNPVWKFVTGIFAGIPLGVVGAIVSIGTGPYYTRDINITKEKLDGQRESLNSLLVKVGEMKKELNQLKGKELSEEEPSVKNKLKGDISKLEKKIDNAEKEYNSKLSEYKTKVKSIEDFMMGVKVASKEESRQSSTSGVLGGLSADTSKISRKSQTGGDELTVRTEVIDDPTADAAQRADDLAKDVAREQQEALQGVKFTTGKTKTLKGALKKEKIKRRSEVGVSFKDQQNPLPGPTGKGGA